MDFLAAVLASFFALLGGFLALVGGLIALLAGLVTMIVAPVLVLVFWAVIIFTSPIWLVAHVILTERGRRGFIIERNGDVVLSFTRDAFKKV